MKKLFIFVLLSAICFAVIFFDIDGSPFYKALIAKEAKRHIAINYGGALTAGDISYDEMKDEYLIAVRDDKGASSKISYFPSGNRLEDGYREDSFSVWKLLKRAECIKALDGIDFDEIFASIDSERYGLIDSLPEGTVRVRILLEEQKNVDDFASSAYEIIVRLKKTVKDVEEINIFAPYEGFFFEYRLPSGPVKVSESKIKKGVNVRDYLFFCQINR